MGNYIEENRGFLTSSKIKLYKKSKEAYKKVYVDEVDTSFLPSSSALENGTMVDQYILSPDEFDKNYVIPAWSLKADLEAECLRRNIPTTTDGKKDTIDQLKAKLYGNKIVLSAWEVNMINSIKNELHRQPLYNHDGNYEHQKQFIVEYKWQKLKGTLDRISLEKKMIRDLKTTKDLEYNPYYDMSYFENALTQNDKYEYGLQLAWYAVLVYIHTGERFDWVIDAVKTSGNFAYESYFYYAATLKAIAMTELFPALDQLIEDTKNNDFTDNIDPNNRGELLNNKYYPILDGAIQKEFKVIEPAFY